MGSFALPSQQPAGFLGSPHGRQDHVHRHAVLNRPADRDEDEGAGMRGSAPPGAGSARRKDRRSGMGQS